MNYTMFKLTLVLASNVYDRSTKKGGGAFLIKRIGRGPSHFGDFLEIRVLT